MATRLVFRDAKLSFWALCHNTCNLIAKCEEGALAETGITPQQYGVLVAMKYSKQPITVSSLAHWLDRKSNSVSMIIDRMVKKGFVRRVSGLRDRRSVQLVITPEGNEKLYQATKPFLELVKGMLSSFSEEELKAATYLVGKLRRKAYDELQANTPEDEIEISIDPIMASLCNEADMGD